MEKWQTVAVLTPGSLPPGAVGAVEVGSGVLLRTVTPAFREKQVADFLLRVHGENRDFWRAEHCFVSEYEASSLGEPDPAWHGMTARGKQDVALDRIRCANMALWISMASGIGFSLVVDLAAENGNDGEWYVRRSQVFSAVARHPDDANEFPKRTLLDESLGRSRALFSLAGPSPLATAKRYAWNALTEKSGEIEFTLLWIALEAMFGPEDFEHGLSARLLKRCATFFGASKKEQDDAYRIAERGWRTRCRTVHGARLQKTTEPEFRRTALESEGMLRTALQKILDSPELTTTFSSFEKREEYLQNLAVNFHPPNT